MPLKDLKPGDKFVYYGTVLTVIAPPGIRVTDELGNHSHMSPELEVTPVDLDTPTA